MEMKIILKYFHSKWKYLEFVNAFFDFFNLVT